LDKEEVNSNVNRTDERVSLEARKSRRYQESMSSEEVAVATEPHLLCPTSRTQQRETRIASKCKPIRVLAGSPYSREGSRPLTNDHDVSRRQSGETPSFRIPLITSCAPDNSVDLYEVSDAEKRRNSTLSLNLSVRIRTFNNFHTFYGCKIKIFYYLFNCNIISDLFGYCLLIMWYIHRNNVFLMQFIPFLSQKLTIVYSIWSKKV